MIEKISGEKYLEIDTSTDRIKWLDAEFYAYKIRKTYQASFRAKIVNDGIFVYRIFIKDEFRKNANKIFNDFVLHFIKDKKVFIYNPTEKVLEILRAKPKFEIKECQYKNYIELTKEK